MPLPSPTPRPPGAVIKRTSHCVGLGTRRHAKADGRLGQRRRRGCGPPGSTATGDSFVRSVNSLVHPQKITLTCRFVKMTLRGCDVGIPFVADRHGARTPCRSSRKPRGVVMAHAVGEDIVARRLSRSPKDFPFDRPTQSTTILMRRSSAHSVCAVRSRSLLPSD